MKTSFVIILLFFFTPAFAIYNEIFSGQLCIILPFYSSIGDADFDGQEELVAYYNGHGLSIFSMGALEDVIPYGSANMAPALFDFNQDGNIDILLGYPFAGYYRIEKVYSYSSSGGTVDANDNPPDFTLNAAYPNPFNPSTSIDFTLEQTDNVKLTIHNINGQQVAVLQDGLMERGDHTVDFTASGLASGVYTYTLEVGGFKQTKSFTLVK